MRLQQLSELMNLVTPPYSAGYHYALELLPDIDRSSEICDLLSTEWSAASAMRSLFVHLCSIIYCTSS